jgi:hypothetical protein
MPYRAPRMLQPSLYMGEGASTTSLGPPAAFGTKPGTQAEDTQGYSNPEFQLHLITGKGIGNSRHATAPTAPTAPEPLPSGTHAQQYRLAATTRA